MQKSGFGCFYRYGLHLQFWEPINCLTLMALQALKGLHLVPAPKV